MSFYRKLHTLTQATHSYVQYEYVTKAGEKPNGVRVGKFIDFLPLSIKMDFSYFALPLPSLSIWCCELDGLRRHLWF